MVQEYVTQSIYAYLIGNLEEDAIENCMESLIETHSSEMTANIQSANAARRGEETAMLM